MKKILISTLLVLFMSTPLYAQEDTRMFECIDKTMQEIIYETDNMNLMASMVGVKCGDLIAERIVRIGGDITSEQWVKGYILGQIGGWSTTVLHNIMVMAQQRVATND